MSDVAALSREELMMELVETKRQLYELTRKQPLDGTPERGEWIGSTLLAAQLVKCTAKMAAKISAIEHLERPVFLAVDARGVGWDVCKAQVLAILHAEAWP